MMCVINNNRKYEIVFVKKLLILYNGILEYNIENVMVVCVILIGLKVDYCMIFKGLMDF